MTTVLARREAYISKAARQRLRALAFENETTISDEVAALLKRYADGAAVLADEPDADDEPPVRVRFKIEADVWREVRRHVVDEDTSVSAIIRRGVAAL